MRSLLLSALILLTNTAVALDIRLSDQQGSPLPRVMVTASPKHTPTIDLDEQGYSPHGVTAVTSTVITRFTNDSGKVSFSGDLSGYRFRARAQGYVDAYFDVNSGEEAAEITLKRMNQQQLLSSYPSNVWLSQLSFDGDQDLRNTFQLNCSFCHQQASPFMRSERTIEQWVNIIERMNSYGARLPNDDHQRVAEILQREYRAMRDGKKTIPSPRVWDDHLSQVQMTEWPIGDGFSQMHDFLLHPNGYIYVGDNLFDRVYEIDPDSGDFTVYQVPHAEDAELGGILGSRFELFPKMNNYMGVHSFAYSKKDGHIFITPSMQQALLEFDPDTKEFTVHDMPAGFYPHTIRTDDQDRVWFTLALSSQVAMFDRGSEKFVLYDLPARGFKEWLVIKSLPLIFSFSPQHRPQPSPDREATGLPMPYGIDVAPKGDVWVARLYANDLAHIDPETGEVTMVDFPYEGPRRLRVDANGNVWIVAFQNSLLVKYEPETARFTAYDLPVVNELPYALNVDRDRNRVWVNGNQSDTIMRFDIASENWRVYPMPRQRFFTRDIEISERDGAVYTTNSHFPTWQSEGAVPTLLRITQSED